MCSEACIVRSLPVILQIRPRWILGYSMAVDGVSLRTMYRQLSDSGPCVMIVEDLFENASKCSCARHFEEILDDFSIC